MTSTTTGSSTSSKSNSAYTARVNGASSESRHTLFKWSFRDCDSFIQISEDQQSSSEERKPARYSPDPVLRSFAGAPGSRRQTIATVITIKEYQPFVMLVRSPRAIPLWRV